MSEKGFSMNLNEIMQFPQGGIAGCFLQTAYDGVIVGNLAPREEMMDALEAHLRVLEYGIGRDPASQVAQEIPF